jgi:hypothetical protein
MTRFDESSRRIEWSENEFSHRLSLQPTATALAVLRMIILHFHPFGFAQLSADGQNQPGRVE